MILVLIFLTRFMIFTSSNTNKILIPFFLTKNQDVSENSEHFSK